MKHFKKIIISSSFFLFSTVIVLTGLEFFLRMYNSNGLNYDIEMWKYGNTIKEVSANQLIGSEHKLLKSGIFENMEIKINSLGFRDREYSVAKPSDVYRIIVLGSSITLGWGVPQNKVYTEIVEERLNENLRNEKIEIINASVGNFNTTREVEYFFERCSYLNPDMVILSFFVNDAEILSPPTDNYFMNNSQLAVLLWSRLQHLSRRMGLRKDSVEYYKEMYADENPGWLKSQKALTRIADYVKKEHKRALVTMIPDMQNLQSYSLSFIHDKVEKKTRSLSFEFIDFYDVLKTIQSNDIFVIPGDPHPNIETHRIMADYLYDYLSESQPWGKR